MLLATTMADRGVDLSALPKEVRDQLAELDLELSEGKAGWDSVRGSGDCEGLLEPSSVLYCVLV